MLVRFVLELRLLGTASPPEGGPAADIITLAVFPAGGIVILRRQPVNVVGWLFCVANIGWIFATTTRSYVHFGAVADPESVPSPENAVWFFTWSGFVSGAFYVLLICSSPVGASSPRHGAS